MLNDELNFIDETMPNIIEELKTRPKGEKEVIK
jgi:hypothetical protein